MKSIFENCYLLSNFSINGFNLNEIKSMSKLFYWTNITSMPADILPTSNVQDFSFMFASTNLLNINLANFNTKNMSHMIYNTSFENLNLPNFESYNAVDM